MIYDSEKITAELIKRRDSIRAKRRKAGLAALCAAVFAALLASALIPALAGSAKERSVGEVSAAGESPSPQNAAVMRRDPWQGEIYGAESWYDEPLNGDVPLPGVVCVKKRMGETEFIYSISDRSEIEELMGFIKSLERVSGASPGYEPEDAEYTLIFSSGRRVFRLIKLTGDRYAVNGGTCRIGERGPELSRFIEASADTARREAEHTIESFDGKIVIAFASLAGSWD